MSHTTLYGTNLKQFAVYLTQYQLLPLRRSAQLVKDIKGHTLSTATIVNINEQSNEQFSGFIEVLKENLQNSPVIHSDETQFYYESKQNRRYVADTEFLTYHYAMKSGAERLWTRKTAFVKWTL